MLFIPLFVAFALPLASQCLALSIDVGQMAKVEKRYVNLLLCDKVVEEDVVHIARWTQDEEDIMLSPRSELTHVLDPRDFRPEMVTQDFEKREQETAAQDPLYLGLTGEKDEDGFQILGQVNTADKAPKFQFRTCHYNAFMGYQESGGPDVTTVYGHLTLASDPTLCVQPSIPASRNSAVVLRTCPKGEDSGQFPAYFKFTKVDKTVDEKTTILSHIDFLGKPLHVNHKKFNIVYSIRFDEPTHSVYIDGRAPNEKSGKGEVARFAFNNRRIAK